MYDWKDYCNPRRWETYYEQIKDFNKKDNETLTDEILTELGFKKNDYKWELFDDCGDVILTLFEISNAYCTNLEGGMTLAFQKTSELKKLFELMGYKNKV